MPSLGEVADVMRRHAELLAEWFGTSARVHRLSQARRLVPQGLPGRFELRRSLAMISSLSELDDLLGKLDAAEPFPADALGQPRGRTNSPGKVYLPDGWLASRDADDVPDGAELDDSGG